MIKEALRFGIVGIVTTLLHTVVALCANQLFDFNTMYSNITGFSVAVLFSFTFNTIWSFQKKIKPVFFARFLIVNCITLLIIVAMSGLSMRINLSPTAGIAMVALTIPVISFISHKYWTYVE